MLKFSGDVATHPPVPHALRPILGHAAGQKHLVHAQQHDHRQTISNRHSAQQQEHDLSTCGSRCSSLHLFKGCFHSFLPNFKSTVPPKFIVPRHLSYVIFSCRTLDLPVKSYDTCGVTILTSCLALSLFLYRKMKSNRDVLAPSTADFFLCSGQRSLAPPECTGLRNL